MRKNKLYFSYMSVLSQLSWKQKIFYKKLITYTTWSTKSKQTWEFDYIKISPSEKCPITGDFSDSVVLNISVNWGWIHYGSDGKVIPRISSGNGDGRLLIFSSSCYQNDRDLERQHFLRLGSQMKAKII